MATYPLKNISIGGDTYEIQAGTVGTAYYNINIVSYDSPDIWNHTGLTWSHIMRVNTDGSVQNVSFGDLYAEEELHSWDLPIFVSLQVVGGGRGMWPCSVLGKTSGSYTIVADGVYNDTACYITITANGSTINSAYGEVLSSGGGGGSSAFEVTLCDQQSNPISVGQFDSSSTLTNANLVNGGSAVSFDAIFTTWKTTDVIINVGTSYDISKRHFRVIAVSEGNSTSIAAVYIQGNSPRYVNFEYSGGAWNMTKN